MKNICLTLLLIALLHIPALAKVVSATSQNSTSHVEYILTLMRLPVKKKILPLDANLDLRKNHFTDEVTLHSLSVYVSFTSKNPVFRAIVDYDNYPGFSFTSNLNEPIVIKDHTSIKIPGKLSFHGVTKDITIRFTNNSSCDSLNLSGTVKIKMRDFGLDSPLLQLLPIDKTAKANVNLHSPLQI